ncbi:MAG: hypothetical protein ABH837_03100 [bacterium]
MDTQIIVGALIFNTVVNPYLSAPIGQFELYKAAREEIQDPSEVFSALATEHYAVILTLNSMGIDFSIISSDAKIIHPAILKRLHKEGFKFLHFPDSINYQSMRFPRDLALRLTDDKCLIDLDLKESLNIETLPGKQIFWSPYGQGGRVHCRKKIFLIFERVFIARSCRSLQDIITKSMRFSAANLQDQTTARHALESIGDLPFQHCRLFQKSISRLVLLPITVVFEETSSSRIYEIDDHVDRVSGLLEDGSGRLHLVVDPQIHSGWQGPDTKPEFGPEETIRKYRAACKQAKIEVHTPKISVPASIGFWQDPQSLKVLMTSGDDEVENTVSDIVGRENVFTTSVPIKQFPAQCRAGIRCLINELPPWFTDLISSKK